MQYSQMYVIRDFLETIKAQSALEAVMLWGPRQIGKTTLLDQLPLKTKYFLDDLSLRERAQKDPALFFEGATWPCLIDEAQYAPNLFAEIKLRIDHNRRTNLHKNKQKKIDTIFYLTGSNRFLLDEQIKESLAGRCHLFSLHGLSVKELLAAFPNLKMQTLLFCGGFPELYTNAKLSPRQYLNDYIISFLEKDIARSGGIEKINEFHTVLRLLAARTGQFINTSEVAKDAGVQQNTVLSWIHLLQRNFILELVPTFATNLSKRVTKMKKLFFYDTGLCARLQGHQDENAIWGAPQAGSLFETLVFSEIMKTKDNFLKDWHLYTWRTKEKNEIDFVVHTTQATVLIEAKMAIHNATPLNIDAEGKKVFKKNIHKIVVTVGGNTTSIGNDTIAVPISSLAKYLLSLKV